MKLRVCVLGVVSVAVFGVACGSAGETNDGGPGSEGGHPPEGGSHPDRSGDAPKVHDASEEDVGGPDAGDAMAEGAPDGGATCGAMPKLLVPMSTLVTEDAPDGGPSSIGAAPLALGSGYLYYLNDWPGGCVGSIPPDAGIDGATPDGALPDAGAPDTGLVCTGAIGSIWRVPLGGGSPSEVVPTTGQITSRFLVTSTAVVYAAAPLTSVYPINTATVYSVPLAGGPATALATTSGLPGYLATDAVNVYFNDNDGVKRVPLAGGSTLTLTTTQEYSFVPIGSVLVLANFSANRIESVPLTGGPLTTLAVNQLGPLYPVACGAGACWLNAGDELGADGGLPGATGSITKLVGGATVNLSESPALFQAFNMAYNGEDFYTLAGGLFTNISVTPSAGGKPKVIVNTFIGGFGLVADDLCVYWSDVMGGIYNLSKAAKGPFTVK